MKPISLVALLLILLSACTRPNPAPVVQASSEIGRYQVVWNPGQVGAITLTTAERAVLVDTVTGRVWRWQRWSNAPHPEWVLMGRIDSAPPNEPSDEPK